MPHKIAYSASSGTKGTQLDPVSRLWLSVKYKKYTKEEKSQKKKKWKLPLNTFRTLRCAFTSLSSLIGVRDRRMQIEGV